MKTTLRGMPSGTIVESTMSLKTLGAVLTERWRRARGLPVQLGSPSVWFHNGQPA
jgi:hypothetical protein